MSDFDPAIRNTALWSGDSRRIASGDAAGVVLEKLGRTEREDISGEEVVRMGHVMQPAIAKIFEDQHKVWLKEFAREDHLTHPTEGYIKSHFDYEGEGYLVECKNYSHAHMAHFSDMDEPVRVPDADYAQCLHEAIVHGTDTVWLAVLFGGQRYREYELKFTDEDKEKWIKRLAEIWGNIQTGTIPPPRTTDQAREIWPHDDSATIVASKQIEFLANKLAAVQAQHKQNEAAIEAMKTEVMTYMGTRSILTDVSGKTLATWKQAKGSKRFDAKLLQSSMPDLYDSYCVETEGSRRFLVKS